MITVFATKNSRDQDIFFLKLSVSYLKDVDGTIKKARTTFQRTSYSQSGLAMEVVRNSLWITRYFGGAVFEETLSKIWAL